MKRCSTSQHSSMREKKIETTRYHLTSMRMAAINFFFFFNRKQVLARIWGNWNPWALLGGCRMVQPRWKTVWQAFKKSKIDLLYDPAIPFLDIYPKVLKAGTQRDICIHPPAPVFLPGESQGRGSLMSCHLWGRTESDMTEAT